MSIVRLTRDRAAAVGVMLWTELIVFGSSDESSVIVEGRS